MKEASLRIASLITSTATTTSAPLLLLFPSRSLSCASAIVALSSTCGRGLRSNVACWRKAENKCCCCRTRRTTRSVAAQNLRHQECQQLGDLGDGGGNATTISLGGSNNNNNSGAFKRKASATIAAAAADDDNDDTQVVDRDDSWWAYLLLSANSRKTYVGVSSNVVRRCVCVCVCVQGCSNSIGDRKRMCCCMGLGGKLHYLSCCRCCCCFCRLRQHNGELAGGAKAARAGRPWHLACTVGSFSSRSQGMLRWLLSFSAASCMSCSQKETKHTHTEAKLKIPTSIVVLWLCVQLASLSGDGRNTQNHHPEEWTRQ